MKKRKFVRKPATGMIVLQALAQRRSEPLSTEKQLGRLAALTKTLDSIKADGGKERDWNDLHVTLDVIELVMNASETDDAAYARHEELVKSVRSAQATSAQGKPLTAEAMAVVNQVFDLFSELIAVCPAHRLERSEMDAMVARGLIAGA